MTERPIERLNYYNGQRLEADDFRLEQEYHVRIQRWLMKSLFEPGVADGLEVYPTDSNKKVLVTPGLALDYLGRAIISVKPVELIPQAPFLCVRYFERKTSAEQGSCQPRGPATSQDVARWGGPARIYSDAEFVWRRSIPTADTRELVIAELDLAENCTVKKVLSGAKRRAVASPQVAAPISVIGEKDADANNPKKIYFHVKNPLPKVFLYLRGSQFSTLFYTEIPSHVHEFKLKNDPGAPAKAPGTITSEANTDHHHALTHVKTAQASATHQATIDIQHWSDGAAGTNHPSFDPDAGGGAGKPMAMMVDVHNYIGELGGGATAHFPQDLARAHYQVTPTPHDHDLTGTSGAAALTDDAGKSHTHELSIDKDTEAVGSIGPNQVRGHDQFKFPGGVQIWFIRNKVPIDLTDEIFTRHLKGGHGPSSWLDAAVVGMSSPQDSNHPFMQDGTGAIPLHTFADLGPGENVIEIRVTVGGCIHYNLYVE